VNETLGVVSALLPVVLPLPLDGPGPGCRHPDVGVGIREAWHPPPRLAGSGASGMAEGSGWGGGATWVLQVEPHTFKSGLPPVVLSLAGRHLDIPNVNRILKRSVALSTGALSGPVAPPPLEAAALVFLAYVSRQAVKPRVLQTFTTAGAASLLAERRLGVTVLSRDAEITGRSGRIQQSIHLRPTMLREWEGVCL